MKFLFLNSWIRGSAKGSGTAVAIEGLHHALKMNGHEVVSFPSDLQKTPTFLGRLIWNFKMRKFVETYPCDAVVGFDIDGFAIRPKKLKVPYTVCIKGVAAEERLHEKGFTRFLFSWISELEKKNVNQADQVITISQYCKDAISKHYQVPKEKIKVVPEGISIQRWKRTSQDFKKEKKTILCVARQYRRKRIQDLMLAMIKVVQRFPNAEALIVGGGPEHEKLQRWVEKYSLSESITLLGEVPSHDDLKLLYETSDLFCLPSIQEGFGIVFLEAMAIGLPIVAVNKTAVSEVVPKEVGILVPPQNPEALAEAMIDILQNEEKRKRMEGFGPTYVAQFDWSIVVKKFLGYFTSSSSTSKTNVALGGMTPPAPAAP